MHTSRTPPDKRWKCETTHCNPPTINKPYTLPPSAHQKPVHMYRNCKQMFTQWFHMCIYSSEKGRVNDGLCTTHTHDICIQLHLYNYTECWIFWFQSTSQTRALYTKHSRSLYCFTTTLACKREPFPSNATCPCKEVLHTKWKNSLQASHSRQTPLVPAKKIYTLDASIGCKLENTSLLGAL